ncbi:MAG: leucyl/phenylalanyl-tRNA--protein transferase [Pseudomonadota bacterium]
MARDAATVIQTDDLINAYRLGYFPMARRRDDPDVVWILPDERGALPLDYARAPRKLKRFIAKEPFKVEFNKNFSAVMVACAEETPDRDDTWINDAIIEAYTELFHLGRAHSVECYDGDSLVGGLYGVSLGGIFCGESLFSRATNASKVAMAYLIAALKRDGFQVLDTQFFTEHLAQFGVSAMPDAAYQKLLHAYSNADVSFSATPPSVDVVLQSITQTS